MVEIFSEGWPENGAESDPVPPPDVPPLLAAFLSQGATLVGPRWPCRWFDVEPEDMAREGWFDGPPGIHPPPLKQTWVSLVLSVDAGGIYVAARWLAGEYGGDYAGGTYLSAPLIDSLAPTGGEVVASFEVETFSMASRIQLRQHIAIVPVDARGAILD